MDLKRSALMKAAWARRGDPLIRFRQNFWAKVDTRPGHGPKGDCWIWTGSLHKRPAGYGNINTCQNGRQRLLRAHVVSYEMHKGPTNGLFVCHECDNPPCVNPDHLWLGTARDNTQDAKRKGRPIGARRTLTDATISSIRNAPGKYKRVAERFGVSKGTVSLIKSGNYPYKKRYQDRGRPPKLSKQTVEEIRVAAGRYADIGIRFGVSGVHVGRIKRGLVTSYAEVVQ